MSISMHQQQVHEPESGTGLQMLGRLSEVLLSTPLGPATVIKQAAMRHRAKTTAATPVHRCSKAHLYEKPPNSRCRSTLNMMSAQALNWHVRVTPACAAKADRQNKPQLVG